MESDGAEPASHPHPGGARLETPLQHSEHSHRAPRPPPYRAQHGAGISRLPMEPAKLLSSPSPTGARSPSALPTSPVGSAMCSPSQPHPRGRAPLMLAPRSCPRSPARNVSGGAPPHALCLPLGFLFCSYLTAVPSRPARLGHGAPGGNGDLCRHRAARAPPHRRVSAVRHQLPLPRHRCGHRHLPQVG